MVGRLVRASTDLSGSSVPMAGNRRFATRLSKRRYDDYPIQPIFGIWMGASPYPAVDGAVTAAEAGEIVVWLKRLRP
jgi:hypothetical protein